MDCRLINFRVPSDIVKKLEEDAKRHSLSKSAYLRMLILKGI